MSPLIETILWIMAGAFVAVLVFLGWCMIRLASLTGRRILERCPNGNK